MIILERIGLALVMLAAAWLALPVAIYGHRVYRAIRS